MDHHDVLARRAHGTAEAGAKSAELVIVAVGASALAIANAVATIINAVAKNKPLVARHEWEEPLLDGQGQIVRDELGRPILAKRSSEEIVLQRESKQTFKASVAKSAMSIDFERKD